MDVPQVAVRITFDELVSGEENRAVKELRQAVVGTYSDEVVASVEKADPDSQDAGTTLVLLFGAPAAVAIAQGAADGSITKTSILVLDVHSKMTSSLQRSNQGSSRRSSEGDSAASACM